MQNQKPKQVKIYYLVSTRDISAIKYVGKTVSSLNKRLSSHKSDSKRNKYHVSNWVKKELNNGYIIQIHLIETCDFDIWEEREIFWINFYKEKGYKLCNISNGGKGNSIRAKKAYLNKRPAAYIVDENNKMVQKFNNSRECADILKLPIVEILKCMKKREMGYDAICHGFRFSRSLDKPITKKFNYWQCNRTPNIIQIHKETKEVIKIFTSKEEIYNTLKHHVKTIKKYLNTGTFLKNTNYIFQEENHN